MRLAKVSRARISDQILAQLKERILEGALRAGEPLPSEMELCDLFGSSRTAVREAVRQLELLGLVESRQGSRRVVRERDDLWALPLVQDLLMPRGDLDLALVPHLLEVHRDFLRIIFERAAERGGPEHWTRLREMVRQQADEGEREAFIRRDFQMWLLLAEASANPLYVMIMKSFVAALDRLLPLIEPLVPGVMMERSFHEPMLRALEEGRGAELRDQLREILEISDAAFLENLDALRGPEKPEPEPEATGGGSTPKRPKKPGR